MVRKVAPCQNCWLHTQTDPGNLLGKIVRFGPNSVSFNSNTALKDIYGFKSNVRKAEFYDAFVHPAPNTHNTRDKALHARKRRVLSQAFSDSAIKEMERYILSNVRSFCEQIGAGASEGRKGWTAAKNMADWCNYLAMDILGDLCFGKAFHMLERPDNRYALELVSLATTRHLIVSRLPTCSGGCILLLDEPADYVPVRNHGARRQASSRQGLVPQDRDGPSEIYGV